MFLRRVIGRSMLPGLVPGDILLVSKRRKPQKGDIVIARQNDREVVKRVKKIAKKRYYLVGDNKKQSSDSRKYGSVKQKDILGVAVWAVSIPRISDNFMAFKRYKILYLAIAIIGIFAVIGIFQKRYALSAKYFSPASVNKQPSPPMQPKYTVGAKAENIPYCNGQALDIYYPRKPVYETAPTVMYFHGGGWQINNKSSEPNQLAVIDGLRDEGFAIVSIDYRKLPENFFPSPVSDALCSVRFLHATKDRYGLDAERIGIYGFSAGGHLAAMVGVLSSENSFNEGPYKNESSRVKAVVALAGIFNFEYGTRYNNDLKIRYFLNGAEKAAAHPTAYITPDDPPFLLVHGLEDQYVAPEQDILFSAALTQAKVPNSILHVKNAEHGLGAYNGDPQPSNHEVNTKIKEFLKQKILN